MKSISMIKEEFKNLTPEQIPAQIALYQEDECTEFFTFSAKESR